MEGLRRQQEIAGYATSIATPVISTGPIFVGEWFNWGGRFRRVPEDFKFPVEGVSITAMWSLWLCGIPVERIGPLYRLQGSDLSNKKEGNYLSKAKFVMTWLTSAAVSHHMLPAGIQSFELLTRPCDIDDVFVKAFTYMCSCLYPTLTPEGIHDRRIGFESYLSFYRRLKRLTGEVGENEDDN